VKKKINDVNYRIALDGAKKEGSLPCENTWEI